MATYKRLMTVSLSTPGASMWRRKGVFATSIGVAAFAASFLPGTPASASTPAAAAGVPMGAPAHIVTIMMENTDYSQFAGSPAMPYLNQLAHEYADFTSAYGWTRPSLPNYIELLSGTTDGTTGRDCDITDPACSNFTNTTLVDQLEAAGLTWDAYQQGDPYGCYQGDGSGNYPWWHNAWRYFAEFSAQCSHISNFSDLLSNLSSRDAADFQWVVPDLVNSGGDNGTMSSADTWLNGELPQIMATPWYREGGQVVILWGSGYDDPGSGNGGADGGQVPTLVVSAHTEGMGAIPAPVNTAGVLHSIEQAYGLSYLGDAANPDNGSLGNALVPGRPAGPQAPQLSVGALLSSSRSWPARVFTLGRQTLALNGIAELPFPGRQGNSASSPAGPAGPRPTIEVGDNSAGEGVVVTASGQTTAVPGTSNLESVACATASLCYAVGLGPLNADEAVLVLLQDGYPASTTPLPAFIGLYGVACPTPSTCYAVGYDNADDADSVTTITDGVAGPPVEVPDSVEWLNAISCPTATQCYAAGLVAYNPSIVPIVAGVPGAPVTVPNAWYLNGIDCTAVGNCVAVGENSEEQGIVGTLLDGQPGTTQVVAGTEYLYGVGCAADGTCLLTGAGTPGPDGYSGGVVSTYSNGAATTAQSVPGTNGFGQVLCEAPAGDCLSVGAAYQH